MLKLRLTGDVNALVKEGTAPDLSALQVPRSLPASPIQLLHPVQSINVYSRASTTIRFHTSHQPNMSRRALTWGGVGVAGLGAYYLYSAGGDPKVAEKKFERAYSLKPYSLALLLTSA